MSYIPQQQMINLQYGFQSRYQPLQSRYVNPNQTQNLTNLNQRPMTNYYNIKEPVEFQDPIFPASEPNFQKPINNSQGFSIEVDSARKKLISSYNDTTRDFTKTILNSTNNTITPFKLTTPNIKTDLSYRDNFLHTPERLNSTVLPKSLFQGQQTFRNQYSLQQRQLSFQQPIMQRNNQQQVNPLRAISPINLIFKSGYELQESNRMLKLQNQCNNTLFLFYQLELKDKLNDLKSQLSNLDEYNELYEEQVQMEQKIVEFEQQYTQLLQTNDQIRSLNQQLQDEIEALQQNGQSEIIQENQNE